MHTGRGFALQVLLHLLITNKDNLYLICLKLGEEQQLVEKSALSIGCKYVIVLWLSNSLTLYLNGMNTCTSANATPSEACTVGMSSLGIVEYCKILIL